MNERLDYVLMMSNHRSRISFQRLVWCAYFDVWEGVLPAKFLDFGHPLDSYKQAARDPLQSP
jgi:hypothetical protein